MALIHDAAARGDIAGLKKLLKRGTPVDLLVEESEIDAGQSPLYKAAKSPQANLDTLQFLLNNGASLQPAAPGLPVLQGAARGGSTAKVRFLLDAGADVHYETEAGYQVLLDAVYGRLLDQDQELLPLLTLLVERGAAVNCQSHYGETPILRLYDVGRYDAVQLLVDLGADATSVGWTGLPAAILARDLEAVKQELMAGPRGEEAEETATGHLLLALKVADLNMIELLAGRCPNWSTTIATAAVLEAASNPDPAVFRWVLSQGISVDTLNEHGESALHQAVEEGSAEVAQRLISAGADVNLMSDPPPYSPEFQEMFEAQFRESWDKVGAEMREMLGTDIEPLDFPEELRSSGPLRQTPLAMSPDGECARLLVAAGADPAQMDDETKAAFLGLDYRGKICCTKKDYLEARDPVYGDQNPDLMNYPFWTAMVRAGATAYDARSTFKDKRGYKGGPVWCNHRFGQSITLLPDGRVVLIGGEHEDYYDEDFCIYNDVMVLTGRTPCRFLVTRRRSFPTRISTVPRW